MNQSFFHVILTRFNLCSNSNRESRLRNTNGWLENRFQLFEKYCLPSVIGQTNQDFVWFIFFDIDTPPHYKKRALSYEENNSNIKLFWVKNLPLTSIHHYIQEYTPENKQLLITTRLDNDDAINNSFIEKIQSIANQKKEIKEPLVINFDSGLCLNRSRAYQHQDTLNAFTSLIEPYTKNSLNTVWRYQHRQLRHFHVLNLQAPFMWLQVIHNSNVSNRVRGFRIDNKTLQKNFSFNTADYKIQDDIKVMVVCENTFLFPIRSAKEFCRMIAKQILHLVIKR